VFGCLVWVGSHWVRGRHAVVVVVETGGKPALRCFQWVTQREDMYAGVGLVRVGSRISSEGVCGTGLLAGEDADGSWTMGGGGFGLVLRLWPFGVWRKLGFVAVDEIATCEVYALRQEECFDAAVGARPCNRREWLSGGCGA
jgi:hypothetical protein